jgi:DNA-binding transcriptional regulator YhcF (GntR family)
MILNGDLKQMGTNAWAAYCIIKAHTSLDTGESFPGIETIADLMGVSKPTAERAVKSLIDDGYVERGRKRGRAGTFKIKESVPMTLEGEVIARGERTYAPLEFKSFIDQLQNFAKTGVQPSDGRITINFTVNVVNQGDNGNVHIGDVRVESDSSADRAEVQRRLAEMKSILKKM